MMQNIIVAAAIAASSSVWANDVIAVNPEKSEECLLRVHSGDHLIYNGHLALQIIKSLGQNQSIICVDNGATNVYLDARGK